MFSLVLLAALTGSGESAGHGGPPRGGEVRFFWMGPVDISPAEMHVWMDYITSLDADDRIEAQHAWCKADCEGRKFLLGQVAMMRTRIAEMLAEPVKPEDKGANKPDNGAKPPKLDGKKKKDDLEEAKAGNKAGAKP